MCCNHTSRIGSNCPDDRSVPSRQRYSSFKLGVPEFFGSSRTIDVLDKVADDIEAEGVGDDRPFSSFSGLEAENRFESIIIPSDPSWLPPISQYFTPPVVMADKNNSRISGVTPQ